MKSASAPLMATANVISRTLVMTWSRERKMDSESRLRLEGFAHGSWSQAVVAAPGAEADPLGNSHLCTSTCAGASARAPPLPIPFTTGHLSHFRVRARVVLDRMAATAPRRIVAFGDSLTQYGFNVEHRGWLAQLANHFARSADVINRGFSGYTTRWAKHVVDDAVLPELAADTPTVVLIYFGANDAATSEEQGIPVDEYRENLEELVARVRGAGPHVQPVVLTPPTLDEDAWGRRCAEQGRPLNRTAERTALFADAAREAASAAGCPCVDTFTATVAAAEALGSAAPLFTDGLHFAEAGNAAVAEALVHFFRARLEGWHPVTAAGDGAGVPLCPVWPYWGDIDRGDPAKSFAAHRAAAATSTTVG